ncbi:MAG: ferrochelatase [Proteobacteria bacterium]|nr:ferrochelatase [Pseudomonadota bacterium]NOG61039.1 ferrochelatase [Pseudomonadota bacterium]
MKYKGNPDYKHDSESCIGVLITNLGTPDAPTPAALRTYLAEFLSDPRVIEVPKIIWWFILHGIILRTRPKKSAEAYEKIWTKNGSPLLDISIKQVDEIKAEIEKQYPGNIKIELAMRYGNPSIESGLEKLRKANASRILIFPLYPQYSAATTASTFDEVANVLKTWRWVPALRMINHYHDNPDYIDALANSIERHWQSNSKPEKLIFSFHGMPQHYIDAGDPYFCECQKSARLVAEKLQLKKNEWLVTFQSRFGPRQWLQPYTDITLKELAKNGIKHVQIICPGFSADCLETIEEIDMQNRGFFKEAGGETFSYIPALNNNNEHIQTLSNIIMTQCQGWNEDHKGLDRRKERAVQLGAKT